MSSKDYHYRSPWEPNDRFTGSQVTAEERRTAEDDVDCRTTTRLLSIWATVESAHQREMVKQHSAPLRELATRQKALELEVHQILREAR